MKVINSIRQQKFEVGVINQEEFWYFLESFRKKNEPKKSFRINY